MSKECFVICPFGEEGSPVRDRSDAVFEHIISPAVREFGYTPERADHKPGVGLITNTVIVSLFEAPLVVADLTDKNPNVFYELALRHAAGKPCIHLKQSGESIPFDISNVPVIDIDLGSVPVTAQAMVKIKETLTALEGVERVNTIVSAAIGAQKLRDVLAGQGLQLNDILSSLTEIESRLDKIKDVIPQTASPSPDPFDGATIAPGAYVEEDTVNDLSALTKILAKDVKTARLSIGALSTSEGLKLSS